MTDIPDFTDTERWTIQTTVDERWGQNKVPLHLADVETRLAPGSDERITCPAVFWRVGECSFIVIKLGVRRYRAEFFYRDLEQMSADKTYDELAQCVVELLQAQADLDSTRSGAYPGAIRCPVKPISD